MEKWKHLNSIMSVDDNKFLVDLVEWARLRLDTERYAQFENDLEEILDFIGQTSIVERIYSDTAVGSGGDPLWIGYYYTHNDTRPVNDKWEYWSNQMANDPAVQYNPEIRIL